MSDSRRHNALRPEQDERVRNAVKSLVTELGSQRKTATKLGVSQQTLSRHISGNAAGPHLAALVARARGLSYDQLVFGAQAGAPERTDDRYPNRARAITAARALGWDEHAIRFVGGLSLKHDTDPSPDEWFSLIRSEADRARLFGASQAVDTDTLDTWSDEDRPRLPPRKTPK